ncbi:ABC transporter substrate-binding protein [Streptomyces sp. NPDC058045]|uniref:ABC transporter substrate-binding protein n=1 Tax=Streptomyces sp. NPDC058045 TaxID=3346311 RepID=UPI0036F0D8F8
MFHRTRSVRPIAAAACVTLLAGCGVMSSGGKSKDEKITVGTTSAPSTLDPAAAWDGSWELFRNIYQTLVSYPSGASAPQPDAAKSCHFTDADKRVYRCTLRAGLTFSDGHPLNAQAVKFSIDRISRIDVRGGPKGLLSSLDRVETRGAKDVVFHLNTSDATFPFVLATPAMSLVDPRDYPADKVRDDGKAIGSGPYTLDSYQERKEARLSSNKRYKGFAERKNDAVDIRYFDSSASVVKALRDGQVDAAVRELSADDVQGLQADEASHDLQVTEAAGIETSFLVFNTKDKWAAKAPVRKAVAQLLDRGALAHKAHADTVEPLYSMVPKGLAGHTSAFFDAYGNPSREKARKLLAGAGIHTPVPLTFWYTTDRYGSATKAEFEEIQRELDSSGLFEVTLKSRPWKTYEDGYRKGEYPVFGRGWFPDFPDAENFIAPFVGKRNVLGTPYPAPGITDELLPVSRRESDRSAVVKQFEQAQRIMASDARLIPLWQGKQYAAFSNDIAGSEQALDPSAIWMMWELHRKESW